MASVGMIPLNWNRDKRRYPDLSGTPNVVWEYIDMGIISLFSTHYIWFGCLGFGLEFGFGCLGFRFRFGFGLGLSRFTFKFWFTANVILRIFRYKIGRTKM